MRLNCFPPEVLYEILESLNIYSIGNLLLTGDHRLTSSVLQVRKLSLHQTGYLALQLPSFLSRCTLLERVELTTSAPLSTIDWSVLPATTKQIIAFTASTGGPLPSVNTRNTRPPTAFDIAAFPRLEVLEVENSLTCNFSTFSASLQSLCIKHDSLTPNQFNTIPSTVHRLKALVSTFHNTSTLETNVPLTFPPFLTYLALKTVESAVIVLSVSLPQSLSTLKLLIPSCNDEWIEKLPKSLKRLSILLTRTDSSIITESMARALPRTLEDFNIRVGIYEKTRFSLASPLDLTLNALPRNLRRIEFQLNKDWKIEMEAPHMVNAVHEALGKLETCGDGPYQLFSWIGWYPTTIRRVLLTEQPTADAKGGMQAATVVLLESFDCIQLPSTCMLASPSRLRRLVVFSLGNGVRLDWWTPYLPQLQHLDLSEFSLSMLPCLRHLAPTLKVLNLTMGALGSEDKAWDSLKEARNIKRQLESKPSLLVLDFSPFQALTHLYLQYSVREHCRCFGLTLFPEVNLPTTIEHAVWAGFGIPQQTQIYCSRVELHKEIPRYRAEHGDLRMQAFTISRSMARQILKCRLLLINPAAHPLTTPTNTTLTHAHGHLGDGILGPLQIPSYSKDHLFRISTAKASSNDCSINDLLFRPQDLAVVKFPDADKTFMGVLDDWITEMVQ